MIKPLMFKINNFFPPKEINFGVWIFVGMKNVKDPLSNPVFILTLFSKF